MNKFLSSVSIIIATLYFAGNMTYAMDEETKEPASKRRKIGFVPYTVPSEIFDPNIIPEAEEPNLQMSLSLTSSDIFDPLAGQLSRKDILGLRAVSTEFMMLLNPLTTHRITDLDLSARMWTPLEERDAFMKAPIGYFWTDDRFQFCLQEGTQLWLLKAPQKFPSLFTLPHLCTPSKNTESLWTSKKIRMTDDGVKIKLTNPLLSYYNKISVTPRNFPNVTSLNLTDNASIMNETLIAFPNLTALNLTRNTLIRGASLSRLKNLRTLTVSRQVDIDYSICFQLPSFEVLNLIEDAEGLLTRQPEMYLIEGLFKLLDQNTQIRDNSNYRESKRIYKDEILFPNIYDVGLPHQKSTYPFDKNNTLSEEHKQTLDQLIQIEQARKQGRIEYDFEDLFTLNSRIQTQAGDLIHCLLTLRGKKMEINCYKKK